MEWAREEGRKGEARGKRCRQKVVYTTSASIALTKRITYRSGIRDWRTKGVCAHVVAKDR